jgi:hypothetical protein
MVIYYVTTIVFVLFNYLAHNFFVGVVSMLLTMLGYTFIW